MLKKISNILPKEERYYVIGISSDKETIQYKLLTVRLKDDELKIINRFSSNTLDDVFKSKLSSSYPVLIHVDGDIVISKTVNNEPNYRNNLIFKANTEDFYFYEYYQDDQIFVSVCRKNKVNVFFNEILALNLFVLHIAIGPFVMVNLITLLKEETVISSEFDTINFLEHKIESVIDNGSDESCFINNEKLKGNEVTLLASFFDYKFPNPSLEIDTSFLHVNASEFKYKKWFKIIGLFALSFIMLTLFIGHHLNSYYQNELAQKQFEYNNALITTTKIKRLEAEVALKKNILLNNRINNKNFITKYISEISNSVPNTITLIEVSVFPETRKKRANEKINFKSSVLNIEGEAINDEAFNIWAKKIQKFSWVDKMEIVEYSQTNRLNTFKIKIIL